LIIEILLGLYRFGTYHYVLDFACASRYISETNKEKRMARNRAPGAGRKPRGEFRGKSETLATRVMPSTRAALDRAARKNKRSLSQEVEYRLRLSMFDARKNYAKHIRALGEAVMLVAQFVERASEKRWNEDAFTGEALRRGVELLISHFATRGNPITPPTVEKAVANRPGAGESYRSAAGLGETESGRVIALIESWAFRSLEEIVEGARTMPGLQVPDEWYMHTDLLRDLGSGLERARSFESSRREKEKRS
jgi:hypothetical protein